MLDFPTPPSADAKFGPWFAALAERLLNRCDFRVNRERYRIAEVEMYYHGGVHPDPFSHRHRLQSECGRWCFHRTGESYRGGSFKGLDLTGGDGSAHFGILIRTVVTPAGVVIDGPSRTVDHLLKTCGAKSVAELDAAIGERTIGDTSSPLHLAEAETPRSATVFSTARVGLSLKNAAMKPDAEKFLLRRYRFLTEPRAITKSRPHLVLALHRDGESAGAIQAVTGIRKAVVEKYVADFEVGQACRGFAAYLGADLDTAAWCKLHGTWAAAFR